MGEIGIPRDQFLHELKWWEIQLIIEGYERRHRHTWAAARWSTFHVMSAQVGTKGMQDAGLRNPTDLIEFPWEHVAPDIPDQSEIDEMQALMRSINQRHNQSATP